jgi:hypothetical protein
MYKFISELLRHQFTRTSYARTPHARIVYNQRRFPVTVANKNGLLAKV